jgi:hypothetical protein
MELVGFRSRHAVSCLVDRLVAEDLITKDPQGKLIPHACNGGAAARHRGSRLPFSGVFARPPSCRAPHEGGRAKNPLFLVLVSLLWEATLAIPYG